MAAWAVRGTPVFDTNSGTHTVTATPAVGDLIVIVAQASNLAPMPLPTDNNADGLGTYYQVSVAVNSAGVDSVAVYVRRRLIGSATSTVFTETGPASTGGGLGVYAITGMTMYGPSSVRLVGAASDRTSAVATTIGWRGTAAGTNPCLSVINNNTNVAGLTKPTSFDTLRLNTGYNSPSTGVAITSDDTGNTDTTVTWGSNSASGYGIIAVEFDASATFTPARPPQVFDEFAVCHAASF